MAKKQKNTKKRMYWWHKKQLNNENKETSRKGLWSNQQTHVKTICNNGLQHLHYINLFSRSSPINTAANSIQLPKSSEVHKSLTITNKTCSIRPELEAFCSKNKTILSSPTHTYKRRDISNVRFNKPSFGYVHSSIWSCKKEGISF